MAKDQLARGARSATYGTSGRVGDEIVLKNVAPEEEVDAQVTGPAPVVPAKPRKKFTPKGDTILVRQSEAETVGKTYTDQQSALSDKSTDVVLVTDEEAKKNDAPAEGVVLAVGPGSDEYEMTVSIGDNVVFGKYSGAAFKLNGEWLLIMRVNEVLGTLSDDVEDEVEETIVEGTWRGGSFYPADGSKPYLAQETK